MSVRGRDHRDLVIEQLADDEGQLTEQIASLSMDVGTYRDLAIATLDALRDVTIQNAKLTALNQERQDECRRLREELLLRAGADDVQEITK